MNDPEGIRKDFLEPFVAQQKSFGAFPAEWIERAFRNVPRHLFIRRLQTSPSSCRNLDRHRPADDDLREIYSDQAIMIHDPPSSSSQPWLMAQMLGHLDVKPGMRVLEIGTGSGFNAGLLSVGTGEPRLVFSIDIQPDLVEEAAEHLHDSGIHGVNLLAADAAAGWPDAAPFDRIIATAGCPDISPAWIDQLADDGILLLPFSTPGFGDPLLRLAKQDGIVSGSFVGGSNFMPLQGAMRLEGRPLAGQSAPPAGCRRTLRLYAHPPGDLMFFLLGSPFLRPGAFEWLRDPVRWKIAGVNGRWTMVYEYERRLLSCSGSPGTVWNLVRRMEGWRALGAPKMSDFRVEVTDAPSDSSSPADWIDARPHVRLRISLPA